jgi:hypothetical protein
MLLKFRYARCSDLVLIVIGTTFAVLHGASFPILALIFGKMTNTLIKQVCESFIYSLRWAVICHFREKEAYLIFWISLCARNIIFFKFENSCNYCIIWYINHVYYKWWRSIFFYFRSLKQRPIEDSCARHLHLPFIYNRVKNKKMKE